VTQSSGAPGTIATAFDFTRQMRSPEFREELRTRGWRPEHDIVVTADGELAMVVFGRILANQTSSPCLLVWPSPIEPAKLLFMFAISGRLPRGFHLKKRVSSTEITPSTSIGMIYDSMRECADYVPPDWGCTIRFAVEAPV
jgi:hypothetical protein